MRLSATQSNKQANKPMTIRARKTMSSAFSFLTHCLPQCSQPSPSLPTLSFPSSPQGFCQGKAPGLSTGTSTLTQKYPSPPHPSVSPSPSCLPLTPSPYLHCCSGPKPGPSGYKATALPPSCIIYPQSFLVLTLKHCSPVILVP